MRLVAVAVPVPFLDLLAYNVPDRLDLPAIGARVRVPVGSRTLTGCVIEHGASLDARTDAKDVIDVLDSEPFLPKTVIALARWVAEYYVAGIGDAIAVAMPPGAARRASSYKTRRIVSITAHGLSTVRLKPDTTYRRRRSSVRL